MKADKDKLIKQLKTAKGQLEGIIKMIEDDKYCIEISNQILAAKAIINKINTKILCSHIETCVYDAINSNNKEEKKIKIKELESIFDRIYKS